MKNVDGIIDWYLTPLFSSEYYQVNWARGLDERINNAGGEAWSKARWGIKNIKAL